jgi:enamine deaminase RidA (YjgF/YER057c/UK114 family)
MSYQIHNPPTLAVPTGYSHVAIVPAGKQAHIAGQVALDAGGKVVGRGDLAAQAEQVFANLEQALAAAGASFKDVFKIVTFVVDLSPDKAAAVRQVRNKYFGDGPYPAGTMVGVTSLVNPDLLLEIEAIATVS